MEEKTAATPPPLPGTPAAAQREWGTVEFSRESPARAAQRVKRNWAKIVGIGVLVAVPLVLGVMLLATSVQKHQQNQQQLRAALDSIDHSLSDAPGSAGAGAPPAARAPTRSESQEEAVARGMSEIARLVGQARRHGAELEAQLGALPLDKVFSAQTMVSRSGIADAHKTLEQASVIIDDYEKTFADYYREAETLLKSLPEPARSQGLRGFQNGRSSRVAERYVANERNIIRIGNALLDLAESQLGKTEAQGGAIVFSDAASLAKFQSLQAELQLATEQESQVIAEMQQMKQTAQSQVTNLRRLLDAK